MSALINELRRNVKKNIKASFVINGKFVVDRREISNRFNKFFASVAKKLNTSTLNGNHQNTDDQYYLRNRVQKSIFLSPTSPKELEEIVSGRENEKSSEISIVILKKCFQFISANISGFFNEFVAAGTRQHMQAARHQLRPGLGIDQ